MKILFKLLIAVSFKVNQYIDIKFIYYGNLRLLHFWRDLRIVAVFACINKDTSNKCKHI